MLVILLLFFPGNSFVIVLVVTVKSVEFFIARGVKYCDDFSSGLFDSRHEFFCELL
jgi:hypothetical protein